MLQEVTHSVTCHWPFPQRRHESQGVHVRDKILNTLRSGPDAWQSNRVCNKHTKPNMIFRNFVVQTAVQNTVAVTPSTSKAKHCTMIVLAKQLSVTRVNLAPRFSQGMIMKFKDTTCPSGFTPPRTLPPHPRLSIVPWWFLPSCLWQELSWHQHFSFSVCGAD